MEEKNPNIAIRAFFKKCMWWKHENKMEKNVKISLIIAAVVIVGALGWYCKGTFIAATVNGRPISRLAVMQEAEKQSGKAVLDALISRKLVEKEESKKGIVVSEEEVNAALSKIEASVIAQGGTMDQALSQQGITKEALRKDVAEQEKLKKLLADKVQVTDDEAVKYMKDNKLTAPAGEESVFIIRVKDYLLQQKLGTAAQELVTSLRGEASIQYFVSY